MAAHTLIRRACVLAPLVLLAVAAAFLLSPEPSDDAPVPAAAPEERSGGVEESAPSRRVETEPRSGESAGVAPARVGELAEEGRAPRPLGAEEKAVPSPDPTPPSAPAPGAAAAPSGPDLAKINKEDIRSAIRELMPRVRDCYEQGLKQDPTLEGKVVVQFTLAKFPTGGTYAREGELQKSSLRAPLVEACILSKIQNAHFPEIKGEGEVRVTYPFLFSPGGGFGGTDPDTRLQVH